MLLQHKNTPVTTDADKVDKNVCAFIYKRHSFFLIFDLNNNSQHRRVTQMIKCLVFIL